MRMPRSRQVLSVLIVCVLLAGFASVASAVDKICLDFAGVDTRTDLTAQQKTDLKDKIKQVAKDNLGADFPVVSGANCTGAKRTIHYVKDAHNPDDRYGEWTNGSTDVYVYVGAFMDDAQVSGAFTTAGDWDTTKLANGLGETGCHECGHSYSVGHNTHAPPDKMTEGSLVGAAKRAAGGRNFDDPAKKVIKENLGKDPCKTATDYDEKATVSYIYDAVPLGVNKEEDGFDDGTRVADARLNIAGSLPGYFFGYIAGSTAHPYFVAKSSLEGGFQMDYLTWFQFGSNHASRMAFAIAQTGSATWVHPDAISFANPTSFGGHTIYRNLTLTWFAPPVTVVLDASFNRPSAANGWAPGCTVPSDCNDNNPCSADNCNGQLVCHHDSGPGLACSDGVPCHLQGRCDPAAPGANPVTGCFFPDNCPNSDPCLVSTCDTGLGSCTFSPKPPPAEAASLSLRALNKMALTWGPLAGTAFYEIVRGSLSNLPVGPGGGDESCLGGLTDAYAVDASTPAPGHGYWYDLRASNGCTHGPYGPATGGPRNTATCDPVGVGYHRDEVDVAADPFLGGCHYSYDTSACGSSKMFYSADMCSSQDLLIEWTDNTCHFIQVPLDLTPINCDQACVNLHFDGGTCTYGLDPACPLNGWIPARCRCFP